MTKYYTFVFFLGILCISLIAIGFKLAGTPTDKKGQMYDKLRLMSMESLAGYIQSYANEQDKLPDDLSTFPVNAKTDPESNKTFDYKKLTNSTYELCTTFSSDSSLSTEYNGSNKTHKKGYGCIPFYPTKKAISYRVDPDKVSTPTPTPASHHNLSRTDLVEIEPDVFLKITSVEFNNDLLEVRTEIKNSSANNITIDLSRIQLSHAGFKSLAITIALFNEYSSRLQILSNKTSSIVLYYKRIGNPPYDFNYADSTRKVFITTASQ